MKALADLARERQGTCRGRCATPIPAALRVRVKYIIPSPRPALADLRVRGGGEGRDGNRRRARADRPRRVPRPARAPPRPLARVHARRDQLREEPAQADRVPGGERGARAARDPDSAPGGDLRAGADRHRQGDPRAGAGARDRAGRRVDRRPAQLREARLLPEGIGQPAQAQGRDRPRRRAPAGPARLLRCDDGADGRRPRPGRGAVEVVLGVDPPVARGRGPGRGPHLRRGRVRRDPEGPRGVRGRRLGEHRSQRRAARRDRRPARDGRWFGFDPS